ncbi:glycerol-3-phosphate acyltransferase [Chloroflexota bacterium]
MNSEIYMAVIAIICAYLIGSFPTAYIAGRLRKGVDIREVGSRNVGAMNVFYKVGVAEGITVLAIDIAKGAAVVLLARSLGTPLAIQLAAGVLVIIGHSFPVFLKFRGGKGGASAIGVLAFLLPWGIPYYIGILIILLLITRYLTLSYSIAFICYPFVAWLGYHSGALVIYSILILLIPGIRYIPRVKEMRATGGSWRRVALRRNLKDRL